MLEKIGREVVKKSVCQKHNRKKKKKEEFLHFALLLSNVCETSFLGPKVLFVAKIFGCFTFSFYHIFIVNYILIIHVWFYA